MKPAFCSCRMCKARRHSRANHIMIQHRIRAERRKVKQMLKKGLWDELPERVPIVYTD